MGMKSAKPESIFYKTIKTLLLSQRMYLVCTSYGLQRILLPFTYLCTKYTLLKPFPIVAGHKKVTTILF